MRNVDKDGQPLCMQHITEPTKHHPSRPQLSNQRQIGGKGYFGRFHISMTARRQHAILIFSRHSDRLSEKQITDLPMVVNSLGPGRVKHTPKQRSNSWPPCNAPNNPNRKFCRQIHPPNALRAGFETVQQAILESYTCVFTSIMCKCYR